MYKNVSFNFEGKKALVTGGARGMGRCIALGLAKAGAETIVLDIIKEGLEALKAENPSIQTVCVDLSDWEATRKAVQALTPIDLVANVAGVLRIEKFLDSKVETFDELIAINTKPTLNVCQIVAKDLVERKRPGSIVNISSQLAYKPAKHHVAYCTSKAALDMIMKTIAFELGEHQIRVNSVLPTLVNTDMGNIVIHDPVKLKESVDRIPMGRYAEVEDIAAPVLFLLSDAASMITGHQLLVDGGWAIS